MKYKSLYTLYAENVIRDENTKKISLLNLFNTISVEKIPSKQGNFFIVFGIGLVKGGAELDTLTFTGYKPDSEKFIDATLELNDEMKKQDESQVVVDLSGMPVEKYGTYEFRLSYGDDKLIASKTIEISPLKSKEVVNE